MIRTDSHRDRRLLYLLTPAGLRRSWREMLATRRKARMVVRGLKGDDAGLPVTPTKSSVHSNGPRIDDPPQVVHPVGVKDDRPS